MQCGLIAAGRMPIDCSSTAWSNGYGGQGQPSINPESKAVKWSGKRPVLRIGNLWWSCPLGVPVVPSGRFVACCFSVTELRCQLCFSSFCVFVKASSA